MIKRYNNLSLAWGIPGFIVQAAGQILLGLHTRIDMQQLSAPYDNLGRIVALLGTIALLVGFAYYAKAKGRSSWWCLFGFLSLIGLVVLAYLADRTMNEKNEVGGDSVEENARTSL